MTYSLDEVSIFNLNITLAAQIVAASDGDHERAHAQEDEARDIALKLIAAGVGDPVEIAKAALSSATVKHQRWYA